MGKGNHPAKFRYIWKGAPDKISEMDFRGVSPGSPAVPKIDFCNGRIETPSVSLVYLSILDGAGGKRINPRTGRGWAGAENWEFDTNCGFCGPSGGQGGANRRPKGHDQKARSDSSGNNLNDGCIGRPSSPLGHCFLRGKIATQSILFFVGWFFGFGGFYCGLYALKTRAKPLKTVLYTLGGGIISLCGVGLLTFVSVYWLSEYVPGY
jgi:hypothetical protein